MRNCPNCNHTLEGIVTTCPNFGHQIVSPEDLRSAADALRQHVNFYGSSLDLSPQGIKKLQAYVENVYSLIELFQGGLAHFFEQHKMVLEEPALLHNAKWATDTKMSLLGLWALVNGVDNERFSQEAVVNAPPGCQGVDFEVMKLRLAMEEFSSHYGRFVDDKKPDELEKSKLYVSELSTRSSNTLAELDKIINQIRPH